MDPLTIGVSLLLLAEAVAALIATAYIVRTLLPERGKEPFLDRLIDRDVRVSIGGAVIAFVIVYSLVRYALPELKLGPLVAPVGALLIAIPLIVMLAGPILDGLQVWRDRRAK